MKLILCGAVACSIIGAGCNPYSSIDKPSGDAQVLSAARACLDQGNYTCASQYYGELASPTDESRSESVFASLAQNGVTLPVFVNAVTSTSSNAGKLITSLAGTLTAHASVSTRLSLFHIYLQYKDIQESHTQGFVRFMTSLILLSEILAEGANKAGTFKATDLVADPTTCIANYTTPPFTGCDAPSDSKISTGTSIPALPSASDSDLSGSPTLYMVNAALVEVDTGLNAMGSNGTLGTSSQGLTSTIVTEGADALVPGTDSPVYRGLLVENGLGAD